MRVGRGLFTVSLIVSMGAFAACGSFGAGDDEAPAANDEAGAPEAATTDGAGASDASSDARDDADCPGDRATDPRNCGVCGRDCLQGTCSAGVCQPWLVANLEQKPEGILALATEALVAVPASKKILSVSLIGAATTIERDTTALGEPVALARGTGTTYAFCTRTPPGIYVTTKGSTAVPALYRSTDACTGLARRFDNGDFYAAVGDHVAFGADAGELAISPPATGHVLVRQASTTTHVLGWASAGAFNTTTLGSSPVIFTVGIAGVHGLTFDGGRYYALATDGIYVVGFNGKSNQRIVPLTASSVGGIDITLDNKTLVYAMDNAVYAIVKP